MTRPIIFVRPDRTRLRPDCFLRWAEKGKYHAPILFPASIEGTTIFGGHARPACLVMREGRAPTHFDMRLAFRWETSAYRASKMREVTKYSAAASTIEGRHAYGFLYDLVILRATFQPSNRFAVGHCPALRTSAYERKADLLFGQWEGIK